MSKVLTALLSTVYKQTPEQIAELLKKSDEEQETDILALDAARVQKFKTEASERFDNGHKKGKSEALDAHERQLREKYGISDPLKGDDLLSAIITGELEKSGKSGGKAALTDDDVRKHPAFLKMENQFKDQLNQAKTDWEKKYNEAQTQFSKQKTFDLVKSKGLELFDGLKPVLSKDKAKAAKQRADFVSILEGYQYESTEAGILVLDKDGKPMQDAHGHTVTFDDFAKGLAAERYDFETEGTKTTPGNGGTKTVVVGGKTIEFKKEDGTVKELPKAKTREELSNYMRDANYSPEERKQILQVYKEEHPN